MVFMPVVPVRVRRSVCAFKNYADFGDRLLALPALGALAICAPLHLANVEFLEGSLCPAMALSVPIHRIVPALEAGLIHVCRAFTAVDCAEPAVAIFPIFGGQLRWPAHGVSAGAARTR